MSPTDASQELDRPSNIGAAAPPVEKEETERCKQLEEIEIGAKKTRRGWIDA